MASWHILGLREVNLYWIGAEICDTLIWGMLLIWIFPESLTSFNFLWGALISTYARAGDGQGALKVLRNCEEEFHG